MAMGTLRAAFAGLGLEAATGSGTGFQSRGSTFNQRPIFSNGPSRGSSVVSLPRPQQVRVGAFTQSAFLDTEHRSSGSNKGQRSGYAVPVPEYVPVSSRHLFNMLSLALNMLSLALILPLSNDICGHLCSQSCGWCKLMPSSQIPR